MTMTPNKCTLSFLLKAAFLPVLIQCVISAPTNTQQDTLYSRFVVEMSKNNCTLPSQIPISLGANEITLEAPLQICNMPEYLKYNREAKLLCNEIFILLRNISCPPQNAILPTIHVSLLADVCTDFASRKAVLPPNGLLGHLSSTFDCTLMCAEEFQDSCKVLLWSFLVQSHMKGSVTNEATKTTPQLLTKSSPGTETKLVSKLQPDQTAEKSNDLESKVEEDNSANKGLPVQTLNELSNALDENEARPVNDNAQDVLSKPKVELEVQGQDENLGVLNAKQPEEVGAPSIHSKDGTEPKSQSNSISEPATDLTKGETKTTLKIKDVIPIQTTFNVPQKQNNDQSDLNPNFEANNNPNQLPKDETGTANKVDAELQPKLSPVPKENPEIPNETEEKDVNAEAGKQENSKSATGVSEMESKNTIQEDNANSGSISETNQNVEGEKVDDSASPAGKSPITPAKEAVPTAESVSAVASVGMPENIPSPTSVPSVVVTPSLEKMEDEIPLVNDKDADQYNDLDNAEGDLDGEYSKQEYSDTRMYEPTKNKEPISEAPKSIDIPKEPVVPQNNEINGFSRESFGRSSDEIQVIEGFPDQEDSHFFFYFLTMVLILMAGYLIFHNKQKIIALIVEGRHERRRRSHGLGYKKLETK